MSVAPKGNNFGALRLGLAYLVILSHSPELIDGNRSREILTRLFGTLSFGELAVDAFFIISGYLITSSYQHSASAWEYLAKRVLRIYPGFIAAFLLCVYALSPWVGGASSPYAFGLARDSLVGSMVLLRVPQSPGAFAHAHYPLLNGSVWTIRYEFFAYLAVLFLGLSQLLQKRWLILALAFGLVAVNATRQSGMLPASAETLLSRYAVGLRFFGVFSCGAVFYLFRDKIVFRHRYAALVSIALVALMFSHFAAEAAVATLGAYLMFYLAMHVRSERLARVGEKTDISYGVYLYAWPIQATIIWFSPEISPWLLFAETSVFVAFFALLSWLAIERPALRLRERFRTKIPKVVRENV